MPALPSVPNVMKMVLKGNSGETSPLNWANIIHWAFTGGPSTSAIIAAVAAKAIAEWGTHMSPAQVNNATLTSVDVVDLTSDTSASGDFPCDVPGTRGDDEIPANVAYLVDYPITRRYRGGHPRQYLLVGGNADFLDAAHWSSAFTSEVINDWDAFLTALVGFTSGGLTLTGLVNVSYVSKEVNPTPPFYRPSPVVDPIVLADMLGNQQMASQRRRIGRHRK